MDLQAMLEKCHREQWKVGDLDWSGRPRPMTPDDEIAVVQYFTDMAGIERLAGALFREEQQKVEDPVLREIFGTFVVDEVRHSHAAQMLADFYDVHHYKVYQVNPSLTRFTPHFVNTIRHVAPDIANAYVTCGELILDIALLRSIDDHVHDDMSAAAMALINRDESRHIAIDFHMMDYYGSPEYAAKLRQTPAESLDVRLKGAWAFANMLYLAAPFFKQVFFEPMRHTDPSGKRLKEAFKRIQLIGEKPIVQTHPFVRALSTLHVAYNDIPGAKLIFGGLIERLMGVDGTVIERLYSEEEAAVAATMSFEQMADVALQAKYED